MLNFKEERILDKKIAQIRKKQLQLKDIEKFYHAQKDYFKIGVEYERLSLNKNTLKCACYEDVSKIIEHFSSIYNWNLVYDETCIIGAYDNKNNSISLEPGMQLEISLAPSPYLNDIKNNLTKIAFALDEIAKIYNIIFLGYGINPSDSVEDIKILNKKRYKIMDKYLPYAYEGELSQKMMRKTAGIQVNIDYFNYSDLYNKLYFANKIIPFVQALSSNSPFEENKISLYKSSRAHIWHYTGAQRCGFFYKNIFKNPINKINPIAAYIKEVLKVPIIYLEKMNGAVKVNGKINFLEYLNSKNGYFNFYPDLNDYILHQSLCFPDVRLKQYIEIRNHDSSNISMVLALCALYKGIFTGDIKKYLKLFKCIKLDELEKYSINSAKYALDFNINNKLSALDIIKTLVEIANDNLNQDEKIFLKPLEKILLNRKTQADYILSFMPKNAHDLIKILNNY